MAKKGIEGKVIFLSENRLKLGAKSIIFPIPIRGGGGMEAAGCGCLQRNTTRRALCSTRLARQQLLWR